MTKRVSRRSFLQATAAFTAISSGGFVRSNEATEELNLAVFGTMYNASHMLSAPHLYNAPIVAFCDPDKKNVSKALRHWSSAAERLGASKNDQERRWADRYSQMARGKNVKIYQDVRRMLDEMSGKIDALVVSHYDHLHGVACGQALRSGKPVCSERPLGMNISDARQLRLLAAEAKAPVTYRSPGTGRGEFRRAMELVEEGQIGAVREVHVWFKRGGPDRDALPQGGQAVPEGLAWDLWLGPLPTRDYHRDWMAYANWRETCNGGLGTFGPHTMIFPFMALKFRDLWNKRNDIEPIRVSAECARLNQNSFPRWERVRWEIPPRAKMPSVQVTWHHGPEFAPGARELIHDKLRKFGAATAAELDKLMGSAGSMLIGESGILVGNDHSVRVTGFPASRFKDVNTTRPTKLQSTRGIYRDWIDACRGQSPQIIADFENGGCLSELLMLGNIATLFPGQSLSYNPVRGQFLNHSEANERLGFEYRDGWKI